MITSPSLLSLALVYMHESASEYHPVERHDLKKDESDWRVFELQKRAKNFKREHTEIVERYAQDLPLPSRDLQIVTVVPAFRELENDNLWNLIESANAQMLGTVRFEILYVVNNAVHAENDRPEAFIENQKTIRLLDALRTMQKECTEQKSAEDVFTSHEDELDKLQLTEHEKIILKEAIRLHTPFFGIDASSTGRSVPQEENPRGTARNIGGHIAYQRLKKTNNIDTGMIDFIDADCFLSGGYYAKLSQQTKDSSIAYKSLYAITPDISEYVKKESDPVKQLAGLVQYLKIALIEGRMHYLVNLDKHGKELERTGHGPAIAVRPHVFRDVGGYPTGHGSEDFIFQDLVDALPEGMEKNTTVRLYLSHRSREDAADGLNVGNISAEEHQSAIEFLKNLRAPTISDKKADIAKKEIRTYVHWLLQKNAEYENDEKYREVRKREFRIEAALRRRFIIQATEVIDSLTDQMMHATTNDAGTEYERMVNNLDPKKKNFLLANQAILESIITIALLAEEGELEEVSAPGASTRDVMLNFFNNYLPEYFEPPSLQEPDYAQALNDLRDQPKQACANARNFIHLARAIHLYRREL